MNKIINAFTTYYTLAKLKFNHVKIGSHPRFCGMLHFFIHPKANLSIGNNIIVQSGSFRNEIGRNACSLFKIYKGASVIIGNYVSMSDVCISSRCAVKIGNYVTIGGDVLIIDSNAHVLDWKIRRTERQNYQTLYDNGLIKHAPIIIEDDVFIGARSIITKGVTIGARSIIAAGSVVIKSIPSDEIWGGNPANFISKIR